MSTRLAGAFALPDGTLVRGRGRREPFPEGPLPEFGLYLGRPPGRQGMLGRLPGRLPGRVLGRLPGRVLGRLLGRGAPWTPDWPATWLDWPDFRTPRDGAAAAAAISDAYQRARRGERVEIACTGGTGRTGTVIACMAVLAGHPAADALAWTRANYRERAVETPGQKRWIGWFAGHVTSE